MSSDPAPILYDSFTGDEDGSFPMAPHHWEWMQAPQWLPPLRDDQLIGICTVDLSGSVDQQNQLFKKTICIKQNKSVTVQFKIKFTLCVH